MDISQETVFGSGHDISPALVNVRRYGQGMYEGAIFAVEAKIYRALVI
jgi:hypothetical protein